MIEAPQEKKESKVADIKDWEGVKGMPQPKPQMDLEGITWVLVDEIEILNKESEDKHIFTIKEAKDSYRSRQKLKYPDGTTVEDTGRAHVDGYSEFKLLNITAGPPGRRAAPHGLRLRRLRARDVGQRQEGQRRVVRRHRPRPPLAQLAGDDRGRGGHRRHDASSASSRSPPAATSTCSTSGSTSPSSGGRGRRSSRHAC